MDELRNKHGLTEAEFLAAYDAARFDRPSVTVDILVFAIDRVEQAEGVEYPLKLLLIRRGDHPCIGQWALPGGFVNIDESLDAAAARELKEETGVEDVYLEQLSTWGDVDRDPRTRIISTAYLALLTNPVRQRVRAGDDAADARWFAVQEKVLSEESQATQRETVSQKVVRLTLAGLEESLSGEIQISTRTAGLGTKVKRKLLKSEGIAFDHTKIIQAALEKVKESIRFLIV